MSFWSNIEPGTKMMSFLSKHGLNILIRKYFGQPLSLAFTGGRDIVDPLLLDFKTGGLLEARVGPGGKARINV